MRHLIISDIHGNLIAFKAVLQDTEAKGEFDEIWCMGDIVGYGPEPHGCIELLQSYDHFALLAIMIGLPLAKLISLILTLILL